MASAMGDAEAERGGPEGARRAAGAAGTGPVGDLLLRDHTRAVDGMIVAGLVALAVGLRWLAWTRLAAIFDDGPIFLAIAEAFASGDWMRALAHPYHPLYPVAVAAVSPVTGDLESAGAIVAVVAGAVSVATLYFFVRRAFGRAIGLVAGLLLCLHPLAVEISSDIQSDGLYLACLLLGVATLWRSLERSTSGRHRQRGPRVAAAAAAGFATGLAYLARPEGLVLAPIGLLGPWIVQWGRPGPVRRALPASAAFALATSCVVVPYVGVMHANTGIWTLSQKPSVIRAFGTLTGDAQAIDARLAAVRDLAARPDALPVPRVPPPQRERPATRVQAVARIASELWQAVVPAFRPELLGFLAIGAWMLRGRPTRRGWMLGSLVALHLLLSIALAQTSGYVSRRHVFPGVVPLFGVIAFGVFGLACAGAFALRGRAAPRRITAALTAGTMGLFVAAWLPDAFEQRREERLAVRRAAEWVRGQAAAPGGIAGRRARVGYYGGRPFVELPPELRSVELGAFLRAREAAFVVVDDERWRDVDGLRNPGAAGLTLVHESEAAGRTARVFRVDPGAP